MLALSKEPQQLVEMVLDSLHHLLGSDYCWVQLIDSEDHNLRLAASRGNTAAMEKVAGLAKSQQRLGEQVITGLKVIVPDLSRDGKYGLSPFGQAGICSLVAVPIRTYHNHGVIGLASKTKKHFTEETGSLLMTIAGLIGASLNITELGNLNQDEDKQPVPDEPSRNESTQNETKRDKEVRIDDEWETEPETPKIINNNNGVFGRHADDMDSFRVRHERD